MSEQERQCAFEFVQGPEIPYPAGTIHAVPNPPKRYGARLRCRLCGEAPPACCIVAKPDFHPLAPRPGAREVREVGPVNSK